MASKKYPLEKLLELRERQKDEAAGELADAVTKRAAAELAFARATQARLDAEAKARALRERESEALAKGGLSVADLQRAGAWEHRVEAEQKGLATQEDQARAGAESALGDEADARGVLAQKQADAKVVENDRARHRAQAAREAEAKAEEEASEAWRKR